MTGLAKLDHLQRRSRIFQSDRTDIAASTDFGIWTCLEQCLGPSSLVIRTLGNQWIHCLENKKKSCDKIKCLCSLGLELEDHFMRCWLIFKLPKGPIKWFRLRIIPSHFLGCGTRELCLHQRASSSRALFSVVVTWSTDWPTQYMVVSSAYRNVIVVLTAFGRSLVYKEKGMGQSTEPCGIPCITLVFSEGTPLYNYSILFPFR